ncbi:MAG: hypothetical protein ACRYGM_23890 [Janthinobacterium lividum]
MSHNEKVALSGVIKHVFAHRFTFDADGKLYLADLGPKGAKAFLLTAGAIVALEGEQRPSEIKVSRISADGREPTLIEHKKPDHKPGPVQAAGDGNWSLVLAAIGQAGWDVSGEPSRKPKHFEVLARRAKGPWTELHIDFAGSVYKEKPADTAKWTAAA